MAAGASFTRKVFKAHVLLSIDGRIHSAKPKRFYTPTVPGSDIDKFLR